MGSGHVRCAGALEANRIGVFLVPPFGATLTILMWLSDTPVAQPYALIAGSVCGAAVGTGISFFGTGIGMALLAMIAAFIVISLIHAYHPLAVALASIPVLLHPGHWFPLLVVLPFTVIAVGSATAMSKWLRGWPVYPTLQTECPVSHPACSQRRLSRSRKRVKPKAHGTSQCLDARSLERKQVHLADDSHRAQDVLR